jgi:hypothetical protein
MIPLSFLAALLGISAVLPQPAGAWVGAAGIPDIRRALGDAEVAEIYIVRPGLTARTNLRAYQVRSLGCLYRIEGLRADVGLRRALAPIAAHLAPARRGDEAANLRVGLVLGDRRGTLLEIYAGDELGRDGLVPAFIGRRAVRLSAGFATALRQYAEAHSELMIVNPRAPHLCPQAAR